jgi:nitroimidazol reductase NimA-like FMN-containing flavoprotein (pyridoxamine 5'-phosphate oxidase superfamily)
MNFPQTERTTLKRLPLRGVYDRELVYAILDEGFICHVGFVADDKPVVIPTGYARVDDCLLIHGSAASRMLRTLKTGVDVCVTVTLLDGLVLARSAFNHSMNYRSVVVFGRATAIEDVDAKLVSLRALSEHMIPGRWDEVRQPTDKELKATTVSRQRICSNIRATRNSALLLTTNKNKFRVWLAFAAIFPATALLLRAEGRLWICACGKLLLWSGGVCSANNSQHFLDPYSFTHVLHGVLFFWLIYWLAPQWRLRSQLFLATVAEAAWEVFENTNFVIERYRTATAALGYNGDTVVNSCGDILCCIAGFLIAQRLGLRRSLLLFAAFELILIVWIHDSLLLEILMLISPLKAIKAWQMC